jgi:hypothetical protein
MEEKKITNDIALKADVLKYYINNKNILSPVFGEVKLTQQ